MPADVEVKMAQVLDLLSPMQIVALYRGSVDLGAVIRSDPHPRKHNAAARASTAEILHSVLYHELTGRLLRRDPDKATRVAHELLLSTEFALRDMGRSVQDTLSRSMPSRLSPRANDSPAP